MQNKVLQEQRLLSLLEFQLVMITDMLTLKKNKSISLDKPRKEIPLAFVCDISLQLAT